MIRTEAKSEVPELLTATELPDLATDEPHRWEVEPHYLTDFDVLVTNNDDEAREAILEIAEHHLWDDNEPGQERVMKVRMNDVPQGPRTTRVRPAPDTEEGLKLLANRAYPGLRHSGLCSRHRESGHYDCRTCYIDPNALLKEHMKVSGALYDQILELSGLSDPPNGRIGTNSIVAELRRKLNASKASIDTAEVARRAALEEAAQIVETAWVNISVGKVPIAKQPEYERFHVAKAIRARASELASIGTASADDEG